MVNNESKSKRKKLLQVAALGTGAALIFGCSGAVGSSSPAGGGPDDAAPPDGHGGTTVNEGGCLGACAKDASQVDSSPGDASPDGIAVGTAPFDASADELGVAIVDAATTDAVGVTPLDAGVSVADAGDG